MKNSLMNSNDKKMVVLGLTWKYVLVLKTSLFIFELVETVRKNVHCRTRYVNISVVG